MPRTINIGYSHPTGSYPWRVRYRWRHCDKGGIFLRLLNAPLAIHRHFFRDHVTAFTLMNTLLTLNRTDP